MKRLTEDLILHVISTRSIMRASAVVTADCGKVAAILFFFSFSFSFLVDCQGTKASGHSMTPTGNKDFDNIHAGLVTTTTNNNNNNQVISPDLWQLSSSGIISDHA